MISEDAGAGITEAAFAEKKATGTFGHIGLRESLLLLADGLGWTRDDIEETLEPMIVPRGVETPYLIVHADEVAGIHHAIAGTSTARTPSRSTSRCTSKAIRPST